MSSLKEADGRYYQQCEVVMIATDNKTNITKIYLDADKTKSVLMANKPVNDNYKEYINLYITSNEEIKEGDWFIIDNKIHQCIGHYNHYICINKKGDSILPISCKKIISSTDESLGLPKPSDSFISKYIEEYNKGNIISDVLVEYEGKRKWMQEHIDTTSYIDYNLKVDSNNTITIKKVKDSYSK